MENTYKLKVLFIILFLTGGLEETKAQVHNINYSETVQLEGYSNVKLFKSATNWYLGARRVEKVERIRSQTENTISDKTVYFFDKDGGFIQIALDIKQERPHPVVISYTVKIETSEGQYSYTIENFYYKLIGDRSGECYQYIPLEENPPEKCKTTWGLIHYKNVRSKIEVTAREYIEQILIPQLKEWMKK